MPSKRVLNWSNVGAAGTRPSRGTACIAPTAGSGSVQSGNQLAAGPELDRRAGQIVADRLAVTAEMRREEGFRDGGEGAAGFRAAPAPARLSIINIRRREIP